MYSQTNNHMSKAINTKSANIINRTPAVSTFINNAKKFVPMSENDIVKAIMSGNDKERNKVVESYSLFMLSLASKFAQGDEIIDLISLATIGMKEAMESFNPSVGTKFISYAVHYMYMEISDYFRTESPMIRRSADAKLNGKVNRINDKFYAENGYLPSEDEVIESLKAEYGIDAKERDIRLIRVQSLSEQIDSEDGATAEEIGEIAVATASYNGYEDDIENEQNKRAVRLLLSTLPIMERNVLSMVFGINDEGIAYELDDIADRYGMTSERIRQIKMSGLKKLTERKERVLARV